MRILLVTDEVWNDNRYTNNVLTNWFENFPAEFANIYLAPGIPDNPCCKRYFQVTDIMMLKSILTGEAAGRSFVQEKKSDLCPVEEENKVLYSMVKSVASETLRLMRDLLWLYGKYNIPELKSFMDAFAPDIIFCLRMASRKMLRFERILKEIADLPLVVFTGDDEYTLQQLRISPIYWMRKLMLRKDLKRTSLRYHKYYTLSKKQALLYQKLFHIETDVLMKCAKVREDVTIKEIHDPIRVIYAGRLYCNRWRTLARMRAALGAINQDGVKIVMEVYTRDKISAKIKKLLDDGQNVFLKTPVTAEELKEIYQNSDIALHVESFDRKNRLITKFSFSTKIIDCLASSCAVITICSKEHPGYAHLKEHDAAICISDPDRIYPVLKKICTQKRLMLSYQRKAWNCAITYHKKSSVQAKLYRDFMRIIREYRGKMPLL